jgi:hypothetical protein
MARSRGKGLSNNAFAVMTRGVSLRGIFFAKRFGILLLAWSNYQVAFSNHDIYIVCMFGKLHITKFLLILVMFLVSKPAAVGQTALTTLVMPSGSRTLAMGEVGTALADDENVLFYNPAGLGMDNPRWYEGAVTNFYEQLLPAFKIPDLWQLHLAGCYQPSNMNVGGFGLDFNSINFGTNNLLNDEGVIEGLARSYECVLTAGWGFNFEEIGIKNQDFGISFKYIYSALAPGIGPGDEGVAQSFAFDVGYLWQFLPFMRFGLTFANMGPNINYGSQDLEVPIPFTINAAIAYKDAFSTKDIKVFDLAAELRLNREIVKNYPDKAPDPFYKAIYTGLLHDTSESTTEKLQEIAWHFGFDATFFNTGSIRQGFLIDVAGQRLESHWGWGAKLFNHFQLDFDYIYSPEGYLGWLNRGTGSTGARDGQWGITCTFFRMFSWNKADLTWWKK